MFNKIRYSVLKRRNFLDINNVEVSIEDLLLDVHTRHPTHLVIGAGFYEEFLEDIEEKDDIDELAELSIISEIDAITYRINDLVENLQRTDKKGNPPFSAIKFDDLLKFDILDKNNEQKQELFDFEISENPYFIFNSYSLDNEMRTHGYGQRFEIYYASSLLNIDLENKLIQLPVSFDNLVERITKNIEPKMRGKSHYFINSDNI